jgi:hypothetical protein
LAKTMFPARPEAIADYAEMLFMGFGKEFTSDNLTNLMALWSAPILGWGMKISPWRQISVAWRRKLCTGSGSMDAIEDDLESHVNAWQAGHSKKSENRGYGLSPDSCLGVPEDVLYLYLIASIEWQKATGVVPGGLGLPYREAVRAKFEELVACGIIKLKQSALPAATEGKNTTASTTGTLDPSFTREFLKFQHHMLSNQEKTLNAVARLTGEVDRLHKMLLGAPRDELKNIVAETPVSPHRRTTAPAPAQTLLPPGRRSISPLDRLCTETLSLTCEFLSCIII